MRSQNSDQVVTRPPSSLCILTKARKSPFLPESLSVVKWSLRFYQWSGHSFGWYFPTKKKKVKKWEADLISQQLFILHRLLRNLVEVLWHVSWSKKYTHKDLAFALHNRLPVLSVVSECVSTVVFQVSWSRSIRSKYERGFSSMSHTVTWGLIEACVCDRGSGAGRHIRQIMRKRCLGLYSFFLLCGGTFWEESKARCNNGQAADFKGWKNKCLIEEASAASTI